MLLKNRTKKYILFTEYSLRNYKLNQSFSLIIRYFIYYIKTK